MNSRWGIFLAWLLIQILTLAPGAMRVPLWARSGAEPQHLAFAEMVVVQIDVGTLLFPILFDKGIGFASAISALPFVQLAAFLTSTANATAFVVCLALLTWFAGLMVWRLVLQTRRNQMIAVAGLSTLVLGTPILVYLVSEFSDASDQPAIAFAVISPLNSILTRSSQPAIQLALPAFLLVSGLIAAWLRKKIPPATSYPQTYSPPRRMEDQT